MKIILYVVKDDPLVVNKKLTQKMEFENCTLKHPFSYENPVVEISGVLNVRDIADYNYLHIPALHRYFFITSRQTSEGHIKTITGECDILYSVKDELLNTSQIVSRNENKKNLYLPDNKFNFLSKKQVEVKSFGINLIIPTDNFYLTTSGG